MDDDLTLDDDLPPPPKKEAPKANAPPQAQAQAVVAAKAAAPSTTINVIAPTPKAANAPTTPLPSSNIPPPKTPSSNGAATPRPPSTPSLSSTASTVTPPPTTLSAAASTAVPATPRTPLPSTTTLSSAPSHGSATPNFSPLPSSTPSTSLTRVATPSPPPTVISSPRPGSSLGMNPPSTVRPASPINGVPRSTSNTSISNNMNVPARPPSSNGHRVSPPPPSQTLGSRTSSISMPSSSNARPRSPSPGPQDRYQQQQPPPMYRTPSDGRRHALDESQVLMNPMIAEMRFKGRVASEKERLEEMMMRKIAQKQGKAASEHQQRVNRRRVDEDEWWMTSGRRTADETDHNGMSQDDSLTMDDPNNDSQQQMMDDRRWSISELPRSLPILPIEGGPSWRQNVQASGPSTSRNGGTGRRTGVSAESQANKEAPDKFREIPKSEIDASRIMRALKGSILFSSLDDRTMKIVVAAMEGKTYAKDQTIIRQGDDGDEFYVLDIGTCLCYLNQSDGSPPKMVKEYQGESKDNFFGELALMYNCPRAATIVAATAVHVWAMDRHTFQGVLMATTQQKRQRYERFLTRVPLLANVDLYERQMIADALVDRSYSDGEYILVEGDTKDTNFYMLEEGIAIATKILDRDQDELDLGTEPRKPVEVKRYSAGDFFGELALMTNQPRGANVVAVGPVRCITLDRDSFVRILGPYEDVLKRSKKSYVKEEFKLHQQIRAERHMRAPPSLNTQQNTSGSGADELNLSSQQVTPSNHDVMQGHHPQQHDMHMPMMPMPHNVNGGHRRSSSSSAVGHSGMYGHLSSPAHHHAHSMSIMHPGLSNGMPTMHGSNGMLPYNPNLANGGTIPPYGGHHPVHKSFDYSMAGNGGMTQPPHHSPHHSYGGGALPPPATPPPLSQSMEHLHDEATNAAMYAPQQPDPYTSQHYAATTSSRPPSAMSHYPHHHRTSSLSGSPPATAGLPVASTLPRQSPIPTAVMSPQPVHAPQQTVTSHHDRPATVVEEIALTHKLYQMQASFHELQNRLAGLEKLKAEIQAQGGPITPGSARRSRSRPTSASSASASAQRTPIPPSSASPPGSTRSSSASRRSRTFASANANNNKDDIHDSKRHDDDDHPHNNNNGANNHDNYRYPDDDEDEDRGRRPPRRRSRPSSARSRPTLPPSQNQRDPTILLPFQSSSSSARMARRSRSRSRPRDDYYDTHDDGGHGRWAQQQQGAAPVDVPTYVRARTGERGMFWMNQHFRPSIMQPMRYYIFDSRGPGAANATPVAADYHHGGTHGGMHHTASHGHMPQQQQRRAPPPGYHSTPYDDYETPRSSRGRTGSRLRRHQMATAAAADANDSSY